MALVSSCQPRVNIYSSAEREYVRNSSERTRQSPLPSSSGGGSSGSSAGSVTGSSGSTADGVGNGSATFNQYGGYFWHPKSEGRAGLRGARLDVTISDTLVRTRVSGLTALSDRDDVRKGVADINGETVYSRVKSSGLPADSKFQNAVGFLIFSNSVTSKKGVTFTAGPGQFFPAFALSGSGEADFAALNSAGGRLTYPVTFTRSTGGSFSTNVIAERVTSGASGCGEIPGFASLLSNPSSHYGIRISMSPAAPDNLVNDFAFGTTVYGVRFADGGIISHVGTCSNYHDAKHGRGSVRIEFNR